MSLAGILKLTEIARKPERLIVGLMSGTSLDGLDIAACRISGSGTATRAEVIAFTTVPYTGELQEEIRSIFAQKTVSLEKVCLLNAQLATLHAGYILDTLAQWRIGPEEVSCIASHGQTIYHAPKRVHRQAGYPNATLQIGDGDHLAVKTGIITLSDFRQKDIAAGGEGAPLAVIGDQLLFSSATESRVLLNIGGIANFTFLPAGRKEPALSTDTGPGNTLIDAFMRTEFARPYDANGAIARSGTVNEKLLAALLEHPFFAEGFPKTTGPEIFNAHFVTGAQQRSASTGIEPADLIATLTAFTAQSIALAVRTVQGTGSIWVSGGGARNPAILDHLGRLLPGLPVKDLGELGVDPAAKEALLFAVLANEMLAGDGYGLGKISLPG